MINISKKDKTRFTIRFNPADPKHQRTIEVLSTAGRRKASLIAEAVCEYLAQYGQHSFENAMPLTPKAIPQATADSSEQDSNEVVDAASKAEPKTQLKETGDSDISDVQNTQNNLPFDHDMQQAVLGGLSMFGDS